MITKLRKRLWGFKKTDVYEYILEMNEVASRQIEKNESEIAELKEMLAERDAKIAEIEKNKEAIVSAIMIAEKKAKEIVSEAQAKADAIRSEAEAEIKEQRETAEREIEEMRNTAGDEITAQKDSAAREIEEQKTIVNREIEIKRKAIKNYYVSENKKIDHIKSEVERMRRVSLEAIKSLEEQLREVESISENSSAYIDSAKSHADTESVPESFGDVERNIPIHIIESIAE